MSTLIIDYERERFFMICFRNKSLFISSVFVFQLLCQLLLSGASYSSEPTDGNGQSRIASVASGSGSRGTILPDLFTGTMSYSIPLDVVPGRKGMQPNLSLQYRSIHGNGWIGAGWDVDIGAIERRMKRGVDYESDDYALAKGGSRIELIHIGDEYRAKIEGTFFRIKKPTATDGKPYWEVTDKAGVKYIYGQTVNSRQDNVDNPSQIFKWSLDKVEDLNGNYMEFNYYKDSG